VVAAPPEVKLLGENLKALLRKSIRSRHHHHATRVGKVVPHAKYKSKTGSHERPGNRFT
jgi:hypothetical protein